LRPDPDQPGPHPVLESATHHAQKRAPEISDPSRIGEGVPQVMEKLETSPRAGIVNLDRKSPHPNRK
ncbi:MAG TPA: hypothetical protein VJ934_05480, partial [Desulfomicrobiaceae bacterium]|nr:hypothetical protein [Desulfomicrobiaceae bacterium]